MTIKKKGGRPVTRPNDFEILKLYKVLTSKQMAILYNVSPTTIRSWVHRAKKAGAVMNN